MRLIPSGVRLKPSYGAHPGPCDDLAIFGHESPGDIREWGDHVHVAIQQPLLRPLSIPPY